LKEKPDHQSKDSSDDVQGLRKRIAELEAQKMLREESISKTASVFQETSASLPIDNHATDKNENKYLSMFQHMKSGVAIYEAIDNGSDFIFSDFNPAAEHISQISRDRVIGKRLLELFPNMGEYGLFGALQRVYRTGKPEHMPAPPITRTPTVRGGGIISSTSSLRERW